MRRDEIKLFPGNIETHIRRLDQLADPAAAPLATESPPPDFDKRVKLDYVDPRVSRAWLLTRLERAFCNLTSASMMLLAIGFMVFVIWDAVEVWLWLLTISAAILFAPGIWLLFQLANRWLRRG